MGNKATKFFGRAGRTVSNFANNVRNKTTSFVSKTGAIPRNKRVERAEEALWDLYVEGHGTKNRTDAVSLPRLKGGNVSERIEQQNFSNRLRNKKREERARDVIDLRASSNAKRVRRIDLLQDELATGKRKYKVRNTDGSYSISSAKPNKKALGGSIKRVPTRYESLKD